MQRIAERAETDVLAHVLGELPPRIRAMLADTEYIIDADPIWMGLHPFADASFGRSNRNTSHCHWAVGQPYLPKDRRATTIALLGGGWRDRELILHEMGHALDERLQWDRPGVRPLGSYAATNTYEAFATAFQAWASPQIGGRELGGYFSRNDLAAIDMRALAFFDQLAN